MTGLPLLPTIVTDMAGSVANIIFAFLAMRYAYLLTRRQPDNFLWGYLLYICMSFAAFSISRAVGHLIKQFLFITDNSAIWSALSPFSGGFNTLFFISASAVTIFYHKGVQAYNSIEHKADKLKSANLRLENAAEEMKTLNLHLEEMNVHLEEKVEERTAALSESEKKFRHLYSASKDMVFFCDTKNNVMDINESGLEMLGYGINEPPPLNLTQIIKNEEEIISYFELMLKDGYIKDLELEFCKKDGSSIYVLLSASALFDDEGTMVGCEAIAKDLTRVKTMMEQLVSSEKMASVGQMAAGVAHEINTPLGIILGYSQLMMDDFDEDSETYENLQVIERQTKASRKIVADLLKFSRQSGSARENLNLNEVLADVVSVTEHNLNLDHIDAHLELDSNLPDVVGDAEKLRQVFVNLVNNAHHAMEEQGEGNLYLATRFDAGAGHVIAEIRDTGHGIPEKVKKKIFDPFFTTKPVGKGTGLGLSVTYGIIQDHGGMIEMESPVEGLGQGTLFRIILPVAVEQDSVATAENNKAA
jgi:PAS domain S-box-containing protein